MKNPGFTAKDDGSTMTNTGLYNHENGGLTNEKRWFDQWMMGGSPMNLIFWGPWEFTHQLGYQWWNGISPNFWHLMGFGDSLAGKAPSLHHSGAMPAPGQQRYLLVSMDWFRGIFAGNPSVCRWFVWGVLIVSTIQLLAVLNFDTDPEQWVRKTKVPKARVATSSTKTYKQSMNLSGCKVPTSGTLMMLSCQIYL